MAAVLLSRVSVPRSVISIFAPLGFLVSLTPDANEVFAVDGFAGWWEQVQAMPSYQATTPRFS